MVVLTEKHLYTDVSGNDMCIQGNTPYWLDRVHKTGEGATTYIDTQYNVLIPHRTMAAETWWCYSNTNGTKCPFVGTYRLSTASNTQRDNIIQVPLEKLHHQLDYVLLARDQNTPFYISQIRTEPPQGNIIVDFSQSFNIQDRVDMWVTP